MDFSDQVAIITGSSAGIGEAAAIGMAEGGAKLVINYSKMQKPPTKSLPPARLQVTRLPCRPMFPTMPKARHWLRRQWTNGAAWTFWSIMPARQNS